LLCDIIESADDCRGLTAHAQLGVGHEAASGTSARAEVQLGEISPVITAPRTVMKPLIDLSMDSSLANIELPGEDTNLRYGAAMTTAVQIPRVCSNPDIRR
jgi:hypothetical protein